MKSLFEKGTAERMLADIQLSNYAGVSCPVCGFHFAGPDEIRERDGRKGLGSDLVCTIHFNKYAEERGLKIRI